MESHVLCAGLAPGPCSWQDHRTSHRAADGTAKTWTAHESQRPKWERPQLQPPGKRINKMWHVHTTGHRSPSERKLGCEPRREQTHPLHEGPKESNAQTELDGGDQGPGQGWGASVSQGCSRSRTMTKVLGTVGVRAPQHEGIKYH